MAKLSASKYEAFRTCPRLYFYSYVCLLERVRAEGARVFGDLLHVGLETWWKNAGEGSAPWAKSADELTSMSFASMDKTSKLNKLDDYDVARAKAMMMCYALQYEQLVFERLEGQREGESGIEAWFEVPLRDGDGRVVPNWTMNGKKDGIVRMGVARLVEHKSTSQPIDVTSPFWEKLTLSLQPSIYLSAASDYMSEPVDGVLYDVCSKPDISPKRQTPENEREFTKGKGCTSCGGSAGGKKGIVKGTGKVQREIEVEDEDIEYGYDGENSTAQKTSTKTKVLADVDCDVCKGTGWKPGDAPRLVARQNAEDEPVDAYYQRVLSELSRAPDLYYVQRVVRRGDDELAEARNDAAQCAREIDECFVVMKRLPETRQRWAWPRNPSACLQQFGRRCDFLDVCALGVNPSTSPLYQIKQHPDPKKRTPAQQVTP